MSRAVPMSRAAVHGWLLLLPAFALLALFTHWPALATVWDSFHATPYSAAARNGWATTNNGSGYCTTLIPLNFDTCDPAAVDPCRRSCNWNTEVGFRSAHPGGGQFLLGDGSVRFIAETIDYLSYQAVGGKSDGSPVSWD